MKPAGNRHCNHGGLRGEASGLEVGYESRSKQQTNKIISIIKRQIKLKIYFLFIINIINFIGKKLLQIYRKKQIKFKDEETNSKERKKSDSKMKNGLTN